MKEQSSLLRATSNRWVYPTHGFVRSRGHSQVAPAVILKEMDPSTPTWTLTGVDVLRTVLTNLRDPLQLKVCLAAPPQGAERGVVGPEALVPLGLVLFRFASGRFVALPQLEFRDPIDMVSHR